MIHRRRSASPVSQFAAPRYSAISPSSSGLRCSVRTSAIACAVAHALLGVAVLAPSLTPLAAHAQAAEAAKIYNIPAGPLTATLNRFGREAGVMLSFSTDVTNGLQSKGISGSHTVSSGLRTLLSGTGLDAVRQANGGYTLQASSDQAAVPDTRLPVVHVVGAGQEDPAGPVSGYLAKRSTTGTKTDTSIMEIPQSISVVGREQMEDQKAQNIQDALGYTAGLMTGISAKSPLFDDTLSIRGFEANPQNGSYYRDGMRYMVNLYNGKQEIYGLERIEVLKGPSSILYGAAAPGGIVNTVTKRPTSSPLREINVEYGSHDRKQVSVDLSGPLDDQGIWSYRLTALERKSDTFMDYGRDDRTYIAPALTWRPSAATSLTLLASYQKSNSFYPPAVPMVGSLLPNPNGQIARNRFLGEPNHNKFETNTSTFGYLFEHAFSDTLKVRHSLRYYESDLDLRYVLLSGIDATQRRALRSSRGFADDTSILTMDTNIEKTWQTGIFKHTVLAGVDYTDAHYDSVRTRGTLPSIDIYNPVYQTGPISTVIDRTVQTRETKLGLYLQDQMKIADKLVVLLGGRYDRFNMVNDTFRPPSTRVFTDETDTAFTGRAGLVYLADNGFAPYVSFTQSFEPTASNDRLGARFKPSEGKQFEVGVRYQPPGSDTLLTASLFDLTRSNVLTPDPVAPTLFQVQTGEVRSRGLELELKTPVGKYVDLIAAYTYTDAEVTRSNNPVELGERFNSPRNVASLWMNMRLGFMGMPNWKAGAGARYVSARPNRASIPANGGPAYTLLDARLGFVYGRWSYALNATNLTDRTYIPSMCYTGLCDYGAPRQVTASMSYRW